MTAPSVFCSSSSAPAASSTSQPGIQPPDVVQQVTEVFAKYCSLAEVSAEDKKNHCFKHAVSYPKGSEVLAALRIYRDTFHVPDEQIAITCEDGPLTLSRSILEALKKDCATLAAEGSVSLPIPKSKFAGFVQHLYGTKILENELQPSPAISLVERIGISFYLRCRQFEDDCKELAEIISKLDPGNPQHIQQALDIVKKHPGVLLEELGIYFGNALKLAKEKDESQSKPVNEWPAVHALLNVYRNGALRALCIEFECDRDLIREILNIPTLTWLRSDPFEAGLEDLPRGLLYASLGAPSYPLVKVMITDQLPPGLTHLEMVGRKIATDRERLPATLRSLSLVDCSFEDIYDFEFWTILPTKLEYLDINQIRFPDNPLVGILDTIIERNPKQRSFQIQNCINLKGIPKSLKTVRLSNLPLIRINPGDLPEGLEELELRKCNSIFNEDLAHLPRLKVLKIEKCPQITSLAKLPPGINVIWDKNP